MDLENCRGRVRADDDMILRIITTKERHDERRYFGTNIITALERLVVIM